MAAEIARPATPEARMDKNRLALNLIDPGFQVRCAVMPRM